MWPFSKSKTKDGLVSRSKVIMFDLDKIRKLDHLTPEQIVRLVCAAAGNTPERTILLMDIPQPLLPLTKEVWV